MKHAFALVITLAAGLADAKDAPPVPADAIWVDAASEHEAPSGARAAPFRAIADALDKASPGSTVVVRPGIYREKVTPPSGAPGEPVTIMSAPGGRAVISGARRVGDWRPCGDGVYSAPIDWKPTNVYVDNRRQPMAREPNEGWWVADRAAGNVLTDTTNLPDAPDAAAAGETYIWTQQGNTFFVAKNRSIDKTAGRLEVESASKWMRLSDGDKYYLRNHPSLIDRPGEWAALPDGDRFTVYFRPAEPDDLGRVEIPFESRAVIAANDKRHVRLIDLDVVGSKNDGIAVKDATDVEIAGCRAFLNDNTGIAVRDVRQCTIRNNLVWRNEYGISVSYSHAVTVEENDVAFNGVDGLVVAWKSDDVLVRRNYLHDHLLWGHPDNFQTYRGVTNLRVIDNPLITGGQSVMMEETDGCEFSGNMVVGCGAYMLILGHGNAVNYKIHNNTFAFAGYGCINFTAHDYDLRENVLVTGHGGPAFGIKGIGNFSADRNLLWNAAGLVRKTVLASDGGWHRTFEDFRRANPDLERNSVYADPRFVNAPVAFRVLDSKRLTDCTRDRLLLRGGAEGFNKGDFVEINFDGVSRVVKESADGAIRIEPPLAEKPIKGWLVANWGDEDDFHLDLRLREDSPGRTLATDGGPVGSKIDIGEYARGNFDSDGARDVPAVPAGLVEGLR